MRYDPQAPIEIVDSEGIPEAPRDCTPERKTPTVPKVPPNVVPWDGPRRTTEESEEWMKAECLRLAVRKQKEFCELVEFKKRNVLAQLWTVEQESDYQKRRLTCAEFFDRFLRSEESDGLFYQRVIRPMQSEPYSPTWRREQFDRLFEKHSLAKNELRIDEDSK